MPIEPVTLSDVRRLIKSEAGPHLSLFFPALESIHESASDQIRIGNIRRDIHRVLSDHWMPPAEADKFLKPIDRLANAATMSQPRNDGLAVFLAADQFETFRLVHPSPMNWTLDRRFQVRPLLPSLEQLESYFVLTLSGAQTAMYEGNAAQLSRLTLQGLDSSFESYRKSRVNRPQSQLYSVGTIRERKQAAVFHGQGGHRESESSEWDVYLKQIDRVVVSHLQHQRSSPLVLAGTTSVIARYRSISRCQAILEGSLSGNVDHLTADELNDRIGPIVGEEHRRRRQNEATPIRERDVPVETNAELILVAASEGRIDTLFTDRDAELFGVYYADRRILKELRRPPTHDPANGCHDLIELAVAQTLKTGGSVHAVDRDEMPTDSKMAAALRF